MQKLCTKCWCLQDGAYFLDRDPDTFAVVLSYLRSGDIFVDTDSKIILKKLQHEAEYFQLAGLQAKIQQVCGVVHFKLKFRIMEELIILFCLK